MATFNDLRRKAFEFLQDGHVHLPDDGRSEELKYQLQCCIACWGLNGCPTFRLNVRQAAVYAATNCADVLIDELQMPFSSYVVLVDSKLCDGLEPYFLFCNLKQCRNQYLEWAYSKQELAELGWLDILREDFALPFGVMLDNGEFLHFRRTNLLSRLVSGELGLEERIVERIGDQYDDALERAATTVSRIGVSLLLSLDHSGSTSFTNCKTHHHNGRPARSLPGYDEFQFTSSITLDVRREVREWIQTGKGALTVQTLVVGHWKLQAHGPGHALRKRIHIMPYWRGPVDAPVAIRAPNG